MQTGCVRGVCDDVTCPFFHSGVVLKVGQVHTKYPFSCPDPVEKNSICWLGMY